MLKKSNLTENEHRENSKKIVGRWGIKVTMIDIASQIGVALRPEFRDEVTIMPGTSIADYSPLRRGIPDYILISDVVHDIRVADRKTFFLDIHELVGTNRVRIIIKDIEPGYFRSHLSWLAGAD